MFWIIDHFLKVSFFFDKTLKGLKTSKTNTENIESTISSNYLNLFLVQIELLLIVYILLSGH